MAIGRGVGNVTGADEDRLGEGPAHADQIFAGFRQDIGPGARFMAGCRRGEEDVLPVGVEVPVVPGDVFLDHRAGRRVRRDIRDETLAQHPNLSPVAQCFAVFGAGAHLSPLAAHAPGCQRWRNRVATISAYETSSSRTLMLRANSLIAATDLSLIAAS